MNTQNSNVINNKKDNILSIVGDVVSSYVSNNSVPTEEMTSFIKDVYGTFASLNDNIASGEKQEPAVPISESVMNEYIVCLEDGKKLKMLKRHLKTVYNMTPGEYRNKWNLKPDYPMVAPSYADKRSELARKIRLGFVKKKIEKK